MTTYAHGGSPEIRPAHWAKPGPKPQPFNPDRCGDMTGYSRHIRTGEPLCDACRNARTNNYRAWQERRAAA